MMAFFLDLINSLVTTHKLKFVEMMIKENVSLTRLFHPLFLFFFLFSMLIRSKAGTRRNKTLATTTELIPRFTHANKPSFTLETWVSFSSFSFCSLFAHYFRGMIKHRADQRCSTLSQGRKGPKDRKSHFCCQILSESSSSQP